MTTVSLSAGLSQQEIAVDLIASPQATGQKLDYFPSLLLSWSIQNLRDFFMLAAARFAQVPTSKGQAL